MNFLKSDNYNDDLVNTNKDSLFIFGDNLLRYGKAGQAIIRDNKNTFGIATKKAPDMNENSFYNDNLECFEYVLQDILKLISTIRKTNYNNIYLPSNGIGTGLAQLNKRAPYILNFINQSLYTIEQITKDTDTCIHNIEIYTDGSCQVHDSEKPGAAAAIIILNDSIIYENSKKFKNTTNNQMELLSAIIALKELERLDLLQHSKITLYSDSQYLINGMMKYIDNWKSNNFNGIKNPEYWKILNTFQKYNIDYQWIKGHNNNYYNERVNKLAQNAMRSLQYEY